MLSNNSKLHTSYDVVECSLLNLTQSIEKTGEQRHFTEENSEKQKQIRIYIAHDKLTAWGFIILYEYQFKKLFLTIYFKILNSIFYTLERGNDIYVIK